MEEIALQTHWGWQIAMYLFLGGLAAGTLFAAVLIDLKCGESMRRTVRFAVCVATACLIVGTLMLVTEVRMPLRAMMLWRSFTNVGSWMVFGAWLLFATIMVSGVYALANIGAVTSHLPWLVKGRRPLGYVLLVASVCIAAYTGILLSALVAHPLWNTPLLPVLFTVSAADTGVALIASHLAWRRADDEVAGSVSRWLELATLVLVVAEAVALVALLATVSSFSEIGALSVSLLTHGGLAPWFWLLFVGCGLVIPLAASAWSHYQDHKAKAAPKAARADDVKTMARSRRRVVLMSGGVACLVGGCALRFLVLLAGLPVWA